MPSGAWPNEAFFTPRKAIRMNDEGIEIFYQPAAHSNADSFVLFRSSDVVVAGDVMDTTRFPVIDLANGGSIQGEIDALNKLIDLTIAPTPFIYKDVGTYVIPGHGRLCEQMEVVDYRDMVVLVRDVVADLMKQGKTLDQIKAARPALPYETRYGTQAGVTTNAFVEAIYKSLQAKEVMKKHHVRIRRGSARSPRNRVRAGPRGTRRRARAAADAEGGGAHRRHRLLGVGRHGRLALPHGHADEGRLSGRADDAGRAQDRRRVGSGEGRSVGRAVQVVRRARDPACAGPSAHHVAGRSDAERWTRTPASRRGRFISAAGKLPLARTRFRATRSRNGKAADVAPPTAR